MNIKKNFSKEELKHSLPDYINNNISDAELYENISKELEVNSVLKNEFDEMKETFGFLDNNEFSTPPDNYFTNLSVRINEKIQANENELNWWERLGLIWKILIPAVPAAAVIIFILFNFYNNESQKIEIANEIPGINPKVETELKKESLDKESLEKEPTEKETSNDINNNTPEKLKLFDNSNKLNGTNADFKNKQFQSLEVNTDINNSDQTIESKENAMDLKDDMNDNSGFPDNSEIFSNDLFAGIPDTEYENEADFDSDIYNDNGNEVTDILYQADLTDDKSIEEEFSDLSYEEQNEILNNLKTY
ncbi:MAG TPA: hypothetical protein PKD83_13265 [Ignavibacteria bacterium]|nr:hypothetical protein [Ignavibacteria bacterium]